MLIPPVSRAKQSSRGLQMAPSISPILATVVFMIPRKRRASWMLLIEMDFMKVSHVLLATTKVAHVVSGSPILVSDFDLPRLNLIYAKMISILK